MKNQRKKILAISGSIRVQSTNLHILKAIAEMTSADWDVQIYNNLANLPHFNPDLDKDNLPEIVAQFRELVNDADGVLFCTPEYVFSLPGALKNALEWAVSTTVFSDKPVAVITASASGEKAHESLLLILKTIQTIIADEATLLIQGAKGKVNAEGKITDKITLENIKKLISSFSEVLNQAKKAIIY